MLPIHEFAKLKLGGIKKGNELDPRREFRIWLFDLGWLKKLDSVGSCQLSTEGLIFVFVCWSVINFHVFEFSFVYISDFSILVFCRWLL